MTTGMANGSGEFTFESWTETPAYGSDAPLPRIASVRTTNRLQGVLEGRGDATYVLSYGADGSGTYRGYEQVEGVLGGRTGTFVLEHAGEFDAAGVRTRWTIVPGSGQELAGLRGTGQFEARHGQPTAAYTLDWEIDG